jgi:hypothetical protein
MKGWKPLLKQLGCGTGRKRLEATRTHPKNTHVGWVERSVTQQIVGLRRFAPNPTYIETIFEIASRFLFHKILNPVNPVNPVHSLLSETLKR